MIDVCYQKRKNVWYGAALRNNQVLATDFSIEDPNLRRLCRKLPYNIPFRVKKQPSQFQSKVLEALEEIFNGKDRESYGFKIALDHLSSYTLKVLYYTSMVSVGYVTTYSELAKAAGGIARSVGRVEASNPVPLLIPCHRIVCSDLSIGGYGYWEKVKMGILQREVKGYEESIGLNIDEKKLILFPSKWIIKD